MRKLLALTILMMFLITPLFASNTASVGAQRFNSGTIPSTFANVNPLNTLPKENIETSDLTPSQFNYSEEQVTYPDNWEFVQYLKDNPNVYRKIWEPWITKAAVHSLVVSDNGEWMAFGGGYLYDNEVHVYRWNYDANRYDKIWDTGDGVIKGDVVSLAISDLDHNNLKEVIAASTDGHIYVFEQRHIYDPITNTEFMFDLVWRSEYLGPVWSAALSDLDKDYINEIIAGTWGDGVVIYEYFNHSKYPYSPEHWMELKPVWRSGDLGEKVMSLATGDFNGNGLMDFIVGLRNGTILVYENNGTIIDIRGYPFPFAQDNSYKLIWRNNYSAYAPILSISVGDLDGDGVDEAGIVSATQSVFVLDYTSQFNMIKLYYPPKSYEVGLGVPGEYPIDNYADWMLYGQNIKFFNGTHWLTEPIADYRLHTGIEYNNTAMGGRPDGKYSQFLPNATHNATAILDFGIREEIVGDGSPQWDLEVAMSQLNSSFALTPDDNEITFYGSASGERYVRLNYTYEVTGTITKLHFEVDRVLIENDWRHIRYIKIDVKNGSKYYAIDSLYTRYIDKQLTDVISSKIANVKLFANMDTNYLLLGTLDGRLVAYFYNDTTGSYEMAYDSLMEDNFKLGTRIWDFELTRPDERFPYWIYSKEYSINLPSGDFYTYEILDYDGDGENEIMVTTTDSQILLYQQASGYFNYDPGATTYIFSQIQPMINGKNITAIIGDIHPGYTGNELLVGYYDPVSEEYGAFLFYLETPYNIQYNDSRSVSLIDMENTGALYGILKSSKTVPHFAFGDVDGDGYKDLVLSNGKLYLLRNYYGQSSYQLVDGYFSEINEALGTRITKKVDLVDFNGDGLLDIIVSYDGKKGATYFENVGTGVFPEWKEKKQMFSNSVRSDNPVTNFKFNNLTEAIVVNDDGYKLYAWNKYKKNFYIFTGETEDVQTMLMATYPLVISVNIGPIDKTGSILNFGYHILDVWSTADELNSWTQAIDFADMDGDGKGEVIVGDYDNNVYVFEHMTNNTYKRAYRSPDLHMDLKTSSSPYYSDEFSGISGSFKRRVMENARFLVAGVDMDGDGKQEFVVATQYNIYVFEYIGYDNYKLVYNATIRDSDVWSLYSSYITGITAMTYIGDFDYDGYGEIAVAAQWFLFVFEFIDDGFVEIYEGDPLLYWTYGNIFYGSANYKINALTSGDLDRNGLKEIIMGGENSSSYYCTFKNGFVASIEFNMGTFVTKWVASKNIVKDNIIYDLQIDDQDYDGNWELIIGGEKGVAVLEHVEGGYLSDNPTGVISANPDYPYSDITNYLKTTSYGSLSRQDVVVLPDGRIFAFISYGNAKATYVYYSVSNDGGKTWSAPQRITNDTEYSTTTYIEADVNAFLYGDQIYLVWRVLPNEIGVYYKTLNTTSMKFTNATRIFNTTRNEIVNLRAWYTPPIFLGLPFKLAYRNTTDGKIYVWYQTWTFVGGFLIIYWTNTSTANIYSANYTYTSFDIDYIGHGEAGFTFTGKYLPEQSTQTDLWFAKFKIVGGTINWTRPVRLTLTGWNEYNPAITYNSKYNVTAIVYNYDKSAYGYQFGIISSTDQGYTWSKSFELWGINKDIIIECTSGGLQLKFLSSRSGQVETITHLFLYGPAVFIGDGGNLAYTVASDVGYGTTQGLQIEKMFGVRFIDYIEWAYTDLGSVNHVAVGDTDNDAKREIVTDYYGDAFTVFELVSQEGGKFHYNQTYVSIKLNHTVNDLAVGDSNGNGFSEIAVASRRGNVYLFETIFDNWSTATFKVPYKRNSRNIGSNNIIDYGTMRYQDRDLYYYINDNNDLIIVYDINNVLYTSMNLGGLIDRTIAFDSNNDNVDELYIGFNNGTIIKIEFNLNDKSIQVTASTSELPNSVTILNYHHGSNKYIVAGDTGGNIILLSPENLTNVYGETLQLGSDLSKAAVSVTENGPIIVARFNNETISAYSHNATGFNNIWRINTSLATVTPMLSIDADKNGYDEIFVQNTSSSLVMLNSLTGELIITIDIGASFNIKGFELINLDGDNLTEVLYWGDNYYGVFTTSNYMSVWVYQTVTTITSVKTGDFDGNGLSDFVLTSDLYKRIIVSNGYGSSYMYLEFPINAFLEIGETQGSISTVFGILSNETFVTYKGATYEIRYQAEAYVTLDQKTFYQIETGTSNSKLLYGSISSASLEFYVVYGNGKITVIDNKGNTMLKTDAVTHQRGILLWWVDTNRPYLVSYNSSIIRVYDILNGGYTDHSGYYYVLSVYAANVMDKIYEELIIYYNLENNNDYRIRVVDDDFNPLYIVHMPVNYIKFADLTGDGYSEMITKFGGNITTFDVQNSAKLWSRVTRFSASDAFSDNMAMIDYYGDDRYDVVFVSSLGYLVYFRGSDGATIKNSTITGIKFSIMMSTQPDYLFGAVNSDVMFKVWGIGLIVVKDTGEVKYVYNDTSLNGFDKTLEVNGKYFVFSNGKNSIFGIDNRGLYYYIKFQSEVKDFLLIDSQVVGEMFILVLLKNGDLKKVYFDYPYIVGETGSYTLDSAEGLPSLSLVMFLLGITVVTSIVFVWKKRIFAIFSHKN